MYQFTYVSQITVSVVSHLYYVKQRDCMLLPAENINTKLSKTTTSAYI